MTAKKKTAKKKAAKKKTTKAKKRATKKKTAKKKTKRAAKRQRATTTPTPTPTPTSNAYDIELRLCAGRTIIDTIHRRGLTDHGMYPVLKKWDYVVRNSLRLAGGPAGSSHKPLESMIRDYFPDERDVIERLSLAEIVEVAIPFQSEAVGWAARQFPWEDAFTLATRRSRDHLLTVVRHLDRGASDPPRVLGDNTSVLRVLHAPDQLRDRYNFDSESMLVDWALNLSNSQELKAPTVWDLTDTINRERPDIIHLSVLDTHVMADLFPETATTEQEDGIILESSETSPYGAVDFRGLAEILTANRAYQPALVSFATCFSGGRMAPLVVGRGATAAIGFRDTLYNTVSEAFFQRFYTAWRTSGWDLLAAFRSAVEVMREQDQRYRSVVTLWTASTILPPNQPFVADAAATTIPQVRTTDETKKIDDPAQAIVVLCDPEPEINYCALHNGRELFQHFEIKKTTSGKLPPVQVEVALTAESEAAQWRHTVQFGEAPGSEDLLQEGVHVPLGSRSLRRVQESTRSSLYVSVTCGDAILHRKTTDVTLLPIDQWSDSEEDRRWLPSFVLPRDPAVREIMAGADRYLRALTDDNNAGFDGYQRSQEYEDAVDLQVRAIWCSLLYDWQLRYVNPPPTYSGWSQRLRTPSQVLAEGRGTCIDLALVLASCLEYVGIYPVIILIAGHAFPGWWRSNEAHWRFSGFGFYESEAAPEDAIESGVAPARRDQGALWMVKREGFREVVTPLREGSLAVIESTMLCSGGGFHEAMDAGQENLMDASIFDALVDIQRARKTANPVTPLPIVSASDGIFTRRKGDR